MTDEGDDAFGTTEKLDNGTDMHACDIFGRSPLMAAAERSLRFVRSKASRAVGSNSICSLLQLLKALGCLVTGPLVSISENMYSERKNLARRKLFLATTPMNIPSLASL